VLQERPDLLVSELEIDTSAVVADIGAGGGYLTFRLARRVPAGKIIAVDIDPKMLERIDRRTREAEIENVETLLGQEEDTRLEAESIDLALIVDAYHEFTYPREMMQSILRGLKSGGQVVLVEYRAEDPRLPIKPLHKMTEAQARMELEAVGLVWRETRKSLPWQHVMIFEKPRADGG
jgi:ubiquinone/menaquinone biosynthesis C-methylase UbiE